MQHWGTEAGECRARAGQLLPFLSSLFCLRRTVGYSAAQAHASTDPASRHPDPDAPRSAVALMRPQTRPPSDDRFGPPRMQADLGCSRGKGFPSPPAGHRKSVCLGVGFVRTGRGPMVLSRRASFTRLAACVPGSGGFNWCACRDHRPWGRLPDPSYPTVPTSRVVCRSADDTRNCAPDAVLLCGHAWREGDDAERQTQGGSRTLTLHTGNGPHPPCEEEHAEA